MPDDTIREIAFSEFPVTLQNMHNPPQKLYMRGRLAESRDQRYVCVVGSRKWTRYGRDAANTILKGLAGYPISIVSGLAIGIDSIAHEAALDAGLHCIAFPGSSLEWDELYPREHARLARRIIESGGALMSRWPAGYQTGKWAFPARNVLMAGLSHATLIVEAGQRSGSLMTAHHALEFDRDILAIPGPIDGALSYGPHMLIRKGAALIRSAADLLEALGFERPEAGTIDKRTLDGLDAYSLAIVEHLSYEALTVDMLARKAKIPIHELGQRMSLLELKGVVAIDISGMARLIR